jgi:hypothetical protein
MDATDPAAKLMTVNDEKGRRPFALFGISVITYIFFNTLQISHHPH